jgi:Ca-activated chloride channel family protein
MNVAFLAPERLWLLLLVAALAVAYVVLQRRRPRYALRFTEVELLASVVPRSVAWRRHLPAALLLLSLVAITAAFARPEADVRVPREQATVVVVLDTSLSMQATDVEPDRISAAKAAAARFVEELPERFQVGLVSFSGSASVVVPPTQDHALVTSAVRALELGPSTAIGEAVFAALEAVRTAGAAAGATADAEPPPARIVLLSDGTNTVGRPVPEAAEAAREAGVPVSTIAYGTTNGVVQVRGQLIPVPVDTATLQRLAAATGGTGFTAENAGELSEVYADIGSAVATVTERREVSGAVAGIALLLGLAAAAGSLAWGARLP